MLKYLGLGDVRRIEGTIAQVSQHELKRDGAYLQFVTIDSDDGNSYKIKRVIAISDVYQDLNPGSHVALHIQPFRNVGTFFLKRNFLLASESARGVSSGMRLSTQFGAVLGYAVLTLIPAAVYSLIWMGIWSGMGGGGLLSLLLGMLPAFALLHMMFVMVALVIRTNIVKISLSGLGSAQTLHNGRLLHQI
ncbi:hypothetical protein [Hoeflea sp.]|uniref:hypothetical protein n=1 Tax=Hoeflea sp. TaxID=1940281 RepID=UPI0019BC53E6|nr:hypothetical protein [Hoeflea sp.]MBC7283084.1 hypothetical protein [Hoeflea sp.]